MSLDFYLEGPEKEYECVCDKCDNVHIHKYKPRLFQANITHNLAKMARAAEIYTCLWKPDENNYHYAHQIIEPLKNGLEKLLNEPEVYKKYNSPNGWGLYEHFVPFVESILEACQKYPEAEIKVWT